MKNQECDKMIIAIIQGDEYQEAISELNEHGFYVTILHSSGGFLKNHSVTVLIGLNHEDLDEALQILKGYGERKVTEYTPLISSTSVQPFASTVPMTARVGGVVLFILDVEQYKRY